MKTLLFSQVLCLLSRKKKTVTENNHPLIGEVLALFTSIHLFVFKKSWYLLFWKKGYDLSVLREGIDI
ncbi:MAG: hypothetical protein A2Y65_02035 [Deltaproteobacteria bacterium RBG_13_52_11]|nr:MAG: hypothetical protein A2Y65_02035 [Deltaproteobacteria bacterium RBG_13_52_11]